MLYTMRSSYEIKKEATNSVTSRKIYKNSYASLRWHYPNQVNGSKVIPSSQPVLQAPVCFTYLFSSCHCLYYIELFFENQPLLKIFPAEFSVFRVFSVCLRSLYGFFRFVSVFAWRFLFSVFIFSGFPSLGVNTINI